MKIIRTDNFARETVADGIVAVNITGKREGKIMLEALQATCDHHGPVWYKLVADDYILSRGMEDLI